MSSPQDLCFFSSLSSYLTQPVWQVRATSWVPLHCWHSCFQMNQVTNAGLCLRHGPLLTSSGTSSEVTNTRTSWLLHLSCFCYKLDKEVRKDRQQDTWLEVALCRIQKYLPQLTVLLNFINTSMLWNLGDNELKKKKLSREMGGKISIASTKPVSHLSN